MEDSTQYLMTAPTVNGDSSLPRRIGARSMLPSTWINRELRVEYTDAAGKAASTSGVLCDWCPTGPVLLIAGARTILGWDRICLIELAGD